MFRSFFSVVLLICSLLSSQAYAGTSLQQPDLLSLGVSYFDFDKIEPHRQAADFRGEYRWGLSLLPLVNRSLRSWDDAVQVHPVIGIEYTTWNQLYGFSGLSMDTFIGSHFIFTWSEDVGFFSPGQAFHLGSFVEFRSMAELGYRFTNEMRLTGEISHISNAGLTKHNPGAEIAGLYLHIPINLLEKKHY